MKVLGGFGISSADQVKAVASHVHAVVVGSAIVRAVRRALSFGRAAGPAAEAFLRELLGAPSAFAAPAGPAASTSARAPSQSPPQGPSPRPR